MRKLFFLVSAVVLSSAEPFSDPTSSAPLSLLDTNTYATARCLDGSPGAYYYRPATSAVNSSKWIIFLQGGGECVTLSSCAGRAETALGSSTKMPASHFFYGIQSPEESTNPDFSTYNFVFIPYCSGDLHLGARTSPTPDRHGTPLWFAGHNIIEAVLQTAVEGKLRGGAERLSIADADLVIVSGGSAGGMGSAAHVDFVADYLHNATSRVADRVTSGLGAQAGSLRVVGVPIAGFYFSNNWPYAPANASAPRPVSYIPWDNAAFHDYYYLWGAFVPVRCAATRPSAPWECLVAGGFYSTMKSPVFFVESQTDAVVMPLHDGLPALWGDKKDPRCAGTVDGCPPDVVRYMSSWRQHMLDTASSVGTGVRRGVDGIFLSACLVHTDFYFDHPHIDGVSFLGAVGSWLFQRDPTRADAARYVDECGVRGRVMCGACSA
eukprot:TRINITY_DN6982_c0_g1_i1.p1 TRINITY_DN6982_c0_g1~~TRINITY_DN6982_c0_g1_i1.p1  ORF type:complete len:436 (+),score=63.16 TRINITY_DN6982_c0_g1_i1:48-1355(+)